MINKTPSDSSNSEKATDKPQFKPPSTKPPSTLISSYRKRQQAGPFIIWSLVGLLVLAGIVLLVAWLMSGNGPKINLFATETPTPTITPSPTSTSTPTETPTETTTPTITPSPTASAPFPYTVQEGDSLSAISTKFNLGDNGIPLLLLLNPIVAQNNGVVSVGQVITVPNPDMPLPSPTPIPSDIPRGTKIDYTIQAGDTIAGIASKFNSTADDILKLNNIVDANKIQVGQVIVVRVNLVTPTPAPKPTITPGPSPTPPSPFTATPAVGPTATATLTATVTATP